MTVCVRCGRLAMRQWIFRHRRPQHTIPHIGPFQGSKEWSKIWLYPHNDGHEKSRLLHHPIRYARLDRSLPPLPRVGPQRHRQVWSYVPMRAHPRLTHSGPSCWSRATHGPRPRPAKTACHNDGSGHHSSTALTSYAYGTLRSTQSWSKMNSSIRQNAVNKRISKDRKMNPNSNVL